MIIEAISQKEADDGRPKGVSDVKKYKFQRSQVLELNNRVTQFIHEAKEVRIKKKTKWNNELGKYESIDIEIKQNNGESFDITIFSKQGKLKVFRGKKAPSTSTCGSSECKSRIVESDPKQKVPEPVLSITIDHTIHGDCIKNNWGGAYRWYKDFRPEKEICPDGLIYICDQILKYFYDGNFERHYARVISHEFIHAWLIKNEDVETCHKYDSGFIQSRLDAQGFLGIKKKWLGD